MKREHELGGAPPTALYHMGTSTPTEAPVQLRPVSGRILVFDLAHALMAQGVLSCALPWRQYSPQAAQELARERWRDDARAFLRDLGLHDFEPGRLPDFLGDARGALIGWTPRWEEAWACEKHLLCTDTALTVHVLARRFGDLLLLARPPESTWVRLFGPLFAIDDERFAGVRIESVANGAGGPRLA